MGQTMERQMIKYNVWIIFKDKTEYEFITETSGDIGEIVTACQVLYPGMDSIAVEKVDEHATPVS